MKTNFKDLLIALIILSAGVAVSGWLVFDSSYGHASISGQINSLLEKAGMDKFFPDNAGEITSSQFLNPDEDPDEDGLANWQEATAGTDPWNNDTDGDGYLDGEEFFSGYDPLVAAPNDKKELTDFLKNNRNFTDEITGLVAGAIYYLDNQGKSVNPDNILAFIGETEIKKIAYMPFDLVKVRKNDLRIIPDTPDSLNRYVSGYEAVITKNFIDPAIVRNPSKEIEILAQALQGNNSSLIQILREGYKKTYYDLLDLQAPESLAGTHQQVVSHIFKTMIALKQIEPLKTDIYRAALGWEYYGQLLKEGIVLQLRIYEKILPPEKYQSLIKNLQK